MKRGEERRGGGAGGSGTGIQGEGVGLLEWTGRGGGG